MAKEFESKKDSVRQLVFYINFILTGISLAASTVSVQMSSITKNYNTNVNFDVTLYFQERCVKIYLSSLPVLP